MGGGYGQQVPGMGAGPVYPGAQPSSPGVGPHAM